MSNISEFQQALATVAAVTGYSIKGLQASLVNTSKDGGDIGGMMVEVTNNWSDLLQEDLVEKQKPGVKPVPPAVISTIVPPVKPTYTSEGTIDLGDTANMPDAEFFANMLSVYHGIIPPGFTVPTVTFSSKPIWLRDTKYTPTRRYYYVPALYGYDSSFYGSRYPYVSYRYFEYSALSLVDVLVPIFDARKVPASYPLYFNTTTKHPLGTFNFGYSYIDPNSFTIDFTEADILAYIKSVHDIEADAYSVMMGIINTHPLWYSESLNEYFFADVLALEDITPTPNVSIFDPIVSGQSPSLKYDPELFYGMSGVIFSTTTVESEIVVPPNFDPNVNPRSTFMGYREYLIALRDSTSGHGSE